MKRGGPPDRRQPLRSKPGKTRAWQDKHRRAIGSGKTVSELAPRVSSDLPPGPKAWAGLNGGKRSPRVVLPPDVKRAARARSGGRCVVCIHEGRKTPRKIANLHHVLPKGLPRFKRWAAESANLIGLCRQHHDRHTNASMVRDGDDLRDGRVPWEALPDVTVNLIARVGGPAVDYCARWYPRAEGEPA